MEEQKKITVILVDDHAIVREGIAAKFLERPEISIVGQCSDGESALRMILELKPDFAIVDLQMPGMSGLEVIHKVRQSQLPTKLIVLSVTRDVPVVRELFRLGVDGFVVKDGPARHLFDAIAYIADGGQYLTPLLRRDSVDEASADPLSQLSSRELEVFSLLVEGMRPKDIGKALSISPKTVDTYRANIMRKLNVDGVAGLVRFAIRRNLSSSSSIA